MESAGNPGGLGWTVARIAVLMEREACQFHRRAGGGHFRRKPTHDRYDFDGRNAALRSPPRNHAVCHELLRGTESINGGAIRRQHACPVRSKQYR
jgi:hypothetical protein